MKTILFLAFAVLFISCSEGPEQKIIAEDGAFFINKTDDTFEVYSNRGVLILEFTPENTDIETLETLEYIYETVKEFYNKEYEEENDNNLRNTTI